MARRLVGRSPRLELLLIAPGLLLAAAQVAIWAGYLWLGGRVEAAAVAAAHAAGRAASPEDREPLAREAAADWLPDQARSLASHVIVLERPGRLAVQVSYDASRSPIYALRRILPAPPRTIVKAAPVTRRRRRP